LVGDVRFLSILFALSLVAGCETYAQHRAALVPHATPLPTDGQPMASAGEIGLGASNLVDAVAPTAGDPTAGDVVPSTQLRGSIALRATKNLSFSLAYERGLSSGSHPVTSSQPPVDDDVGGAGFGFAYSIDTGREGFRIGVSSELMAWSIPWVQYTICVDNCIGSSIAIMDKGSDSVPTLAFGVTPSYRSGPVTVFGGFTARNQPTITEKIETNLPGPADVQEGPYNITGHAGVALDLGGGVKASLLVHQTITSDPIAYGPGVGLMLSIPLGRDSAPVAAPSPMSGPPGGVLALLK
jgi:hypothetical protein